MTVSSSLSIGGHPARQDAGWLLASPFIARLRSTPHTGRVSNEQRLRGTPLGAATPTPVTSLYTSQPMIAGLCSGRWSRPIDPWARGELPYPRLSAGRADATGADVCSSRTRSGWTSRLHPAIRGTCLALHPTVQSAQTALIDVGVMDSHGQPRRDRVYEVQRLGCLDPGTLNGN